MAGYGRLVLALTIVTGTLAIVALDRSVGVADAAPRAVPGAASTPLPGSASSGPAASGSASSGSVSAGVASSGAGSASSPSVSSPSSSAASVSTSTGSGSAADRCPTVTAAPLRRAPGSGRTIALTFDDGPSAYTPAVLDVLAAEHVHATFFVTGRGAQADPSAVARASAEGHLVGNHTYDHAYPSAVRNGWTAGYLSDQIARTDAAIAAATGLPTCFFRPPGGFTSSIVTGEARRHGERVALWSVDPQDWLVQGARDPGPAATAAQADRIVAAATAGPVQAHPVLLLHDGGGYRGATRAALPRIIAYYRAHGYRFVRLDGR